MSRLHRHLMAVLIGDIVTGRMAPGAALPRETDLARQFRVSVASPASACSVPTSAGSSPSSTAVAVVDEVTRS